MNLADIGTVRAILSKNGFSFKKSLGQNFLIDPSVCPRMAHAACDGETGVLEIGPGIGVLTAELSKTAKKTVAVELDERLKPVLAQTLADAKNTEIVFADAMKLDLNSFIKEKFADCERVAVCANLPYYITSPLIMKLLEEKLPIESVTVMVQKEAAERLCAEVGTRDAGAISVAVSYYSTPEILFEVERECFMPSPNVDSAVIQLKIRKEAPIEITDEKKFFRLVKACFAQRRKTLVNTVSNTLGISKDELREALKKADISETARAEQLTMQQLAKISELLEHI